MLEQQALVDDIFKTAEKAKDTPNVYAWEIGLGNVIALASQISPSSLESALKAERIKTLEKAADYLSMHFVLMHNTLLLCGELRRMAAELKERQ